MIQLLRYQFGGTTITTGLVVSGGTVVKHMGINNGNDNHALIIIKATSNRVGLGHGGPPAVGTSPYFSFTYCQLN